MRISWEERQARILEEKQRALQPKEKPRFALRLARFLTGWGEDYEEEVIPAEVINFLVIGITVFVLAVVVVVYLVVHFVF
jgi:hypothetical protein